MSCQRLNWLWAIFAAIQFFVYTWSVMAVFYKWDWQLREMPCFQLTLSSNNDSNWRVGPWKHHTAASQWLLLVWGGGNQRKWIEQWAWAQRERDVGMVLVLHRHANVPLAGMTENAFFCISNTHGWTFQALSLDTGHWTCRLRLGDMGSHAPFVFVVVVFFSRGPNVRIICLV